jgi:hypothetical protein
MKTKCNRLVLAISFGLIALIAIIKLWPFTTLTERYQFVGHGPIDSNAERNAIGFVEGYFKTITDAKTGRYAIVSPDKRSVILKNKYGFVVWSVDVITPLEKGKGQSVFVGQDDHKIYSMCLATNELMVLLEKEVIGINIQSGKVKYYGSN